MSMCTRTHVQTKRTNAALELAVRLVRLSDFRVRLAFEPKPDDLVIVIVI